MIFVETFCKEWFFIINNHLAWQQLNNLVGNLLFLKVTAAAL